MTEAPAIPAPENTASPAQTAAPGNTATPGSPPTPGKVAASEDSAVAAPAAAAAAAAAAQPGSTRQSRLGDRPAASLSVSRAGDFVTCPLMYRLRVIDRIPEPPGVEAARGTLVHAVLERLFDLPVGKRTPESAVGLIPDAWQQVAGQQPELRALLFGGPDAWESWLAERPIAEPDPVAESAFLIAAETFVHRYFDLEDPNRLEPAEREVSMSSALPSGLVLRGIIDRVDRAPNGAIRVVDYKTGRSPGIGWEAKAMFQMRFYGLMLWRQHGRIPARLQLLYLGNNERLTLDPTEHELLATQAKVQALWAAIERATATGTWPSRPSRLCDWCSFHRLCPEQGGTPPPLPEPIRS